MTIRSTRKPHAYACAHILSLSSSDDPLPWSWPKWTVACSSRSAGSWAFPSEMISVRSAAPSQLSFVLQLNQDVRSWCKKHESYHVSCLIPAHTLLVINRNNPACANNVRIIVGSQPSVTDLSSPNGEPRKNPLRHFLNFSGRTRWPEWGLRWGCLWNNWAGEWYKKCGFKPS